MQRLFLLLGGGLLASLLFSSSKSSSSRKLFPPNTDGRYRPCDPKGCGYFGASRGSRKHKGLDFTVIEGQSIHSPIEGNITRVSIPYASDTTYKGVLITGTGRHQGLEVKIFYMTLLDSVKIGASVTPGRPIGRAQDISRKYPGGMTPHVHVEVYDKKQLVNPEHYF